MFADPRIRLTPRTYAWLSARGFRRSGVHVYRPHCVSCNACVAVRVAVDEFRPKRIQRRTLAGNADLGMIERPAEFRDEHFELYGRYLAARHPDSQMEASNAEAYMNFLVAEWCPTAFFEFRAAGQLLAVAVTDVLNDGLSAVYTFFDPDATHRSLGRYAILSQIEQARRLGLPRVYLGYWIRDCRQMNYKDEYAPLEYFRGGRWQRRRCPAWCARRQRVARARVGCSPRSRRSST